MVPCQFLVPKLKSGMEHHGTMDSKRAGFGSWISMNFIWFTTAIHCPMICRLLQPQTSRGSFRNDGPRVAAPFVSPVASLTYYIYTPRSIGYPNMYYCLNSAYGSSIFLWLVNPPLPCPMAKVLRSRDAAQMTWRQKARAGCEFHSPDVQVVF